MYSYKLIAMKRPMTAYLMFSAEIKATGRELPSDPLEMSRAVRGLWHALGESERARYEQAYKANMEAYNATQ